MSRKPEPRDRRHAEEAEARADDLRARFSRLTRADTGHYDHRIGMGLAAVVVVAVVLAALTFAG